MSVTIVVAEDDRDLQLLYRAAMEHQGFQVLEARDGAALMDMLRSPDFRADVLLLDIEMPEAPGVRAIDYIRSQPHLANLKIIVITANEQYRERISPKVDYFLVKPISISDVMQIAKELAT
ncbi:MAG: response regulator [Anaerolineae bacterium]|nr:response regulator [Anaerolineae bacterium]MDW8298119.1 response regulator [Anaerolineae bacterium]